ncbi:hypothetical protein [Glycomyces harbinensis]|uniref:Uncharacterized protein n=1 Tax=Glycomyces harbinensis TaxID=58114 RepID=A0A1G6Y4C7_9ACTN|nr:hypothetical protein [Glycomyces harbinensis]SDD85131.1 hypothetical protein SAMN05216270_108123 [Glycomyces harbinensis]
MTYPPPGGENPQYQLQPEPQQPSDPYMQQGYGSTPPPGNYYQQQPPQYSQQPGQPGYPPQVGVQPGYPTAPGSVLPPPIPQPNSGNNLGIILGVIVAIVVVLGVAAVLIIPGLTDDEGDPDAGGGTDPATSAEASEDEPSQEPTPEASEEPSADSTGTLEGWGTAVSSEDYDVNTPEGAAIAYRLSSDNDDNELLQSVVCANPTSAMQSDVDWEVENEGLGFNFIHWGIARENADGTVQAWAGWTYDDLAPDSVDDLSTGYTFTAVEEDGAWKLCDVVFGAPE